MKERIQQLRDELHRHNQLYYVYDEPEIPDSEFDAKLQELIKLEKEHKDFDPNSPTVRVGAGFIQGFEKVNHTSPMLSLDNTFNAEEVVAFFRSSNVPDGTRLLVEPKIDGLSLELRYVEGRLVTAVTRGDGAVGDDVTLNARTIRTIPLVLANPITMNVRGEVYMSFDIFKTLNEELIRNGEEPFANPRNAASGSMKQKDPAECARRKLSFVAYQITDLDSVAQYLSHENMPKVQNFEGGE